MSLDLAPQRASLDLMYSASGSGDLSVELYVGDPKAGGSEVTGGGYSAGTLAGSGWDAAGSDGVKSASSAVSCGTPTEAWSGTVTHFKLVDSSGDSWGSFPLSSPLDVGGSGSAVQVVPSVFFGVNEQE